MHTIILILLLTFFKTNLCFAQNDYISGTPDVIVSAIKKDLASKDPVQRDKAIMHLSSLINADKQFQKEHEIVLRFAGDRDAENIATDIITQRLAGWYEERESADERIMPVYYPLIHLLSIAKSKTAGITLAMALPIVGFDTLFRKSVVSNKLVLQAALPRLTTIENKFCCIYPGRDLVCDMQAIDFRLNMLRMFLDALKDNGPDSFCTNDAMKKFVSGCLVFGDGNKGRIIRACAVEIACMLIRADQKEFIPAIKKIAQSDPCYLYRPVSDKKNSDMLPRYEIKSKYYPVREKAQKCLSQLGR